MRSNSKFIFYVFFTLFQTCIYNANSSIINVSKLLDPKEARYQERHMPLANNALKNLMDLPEGLNIKMPKVDMCFSGGGVRAQTATLGFLAGAQITGLLQTISSIATLSGSAWAVIPWILHQMPPLEYSELVKRQLQEDFWDVKNIHTYKTQTMMNRIQTAITNNVKARIGIEVIPALHKFGFSELWGHLIARRLIYDLETPLNRALTFKDIRKILHSNSSYPFPIFTTLIAETGPRYEGFEITPYMGYSKHLRAGIPIKHLGGTFEYGLCTRDMYEKPLSFYMGIIGSAYTASPADALIHLLRDLSDTLEVEDTFIEHIQAKLEYFLGKINAFAPRNFDVKIPNIVYRMPGHNMYDKAAIHLLDYGIYFNLPIFPFTRKERIPDVLIIGDASSDAIDCDFTQLKNALIFAKNHNVRFPSLQKYKDVTKNVKIFYEDDPAIPLIIYIANTTKAFTLDMNYDEAQFDSIFQPMLESVVREENKQAILDAIKFKTSQINRIEIPNNFAALPDGKAKKATCVLL